MRTSAAKTVVIIAALAVAAGCSMAYDHPSWPAMGQSESVLHRDEGECGARLALMSNEAYAYAACMMVRGYQTQVRVGVPYMVATSRGDEARVYADLDECGTRALTPRPWAQKSATERALTLLAIAGLGSPLAVSQSIEIGGIFRDCLAARGYTIDIYQPGRP